MADGDRERPQPPEGGGTVERQETWDERYAAVERLFTTEPDPALVELATPLQPGRAVDLGAGEGRNSLWLARQGWDVTAVDGSSVALERVRAGAAVEGLRVAAVHSDIGAFLSRGDPYELVLIANIHPAPEQRAAMLRDAARAVAPGGHLLLVGHHLDSLGCPGPSDPELLYTEEVLRHALPGLRTLLLERRERSQGSDTGEPRIDVVLWAEAPEG
ncbi:MAG: methyltransferase domain-containing protein [Candidatus Dormiibacterota bacterium]